MRIIEPMDGSGTGETLVNLHDALLYLMNREALSVPGLTTEALGQHLQDERRRGLYGDATKEVIREFQKQRNLATGHDEVDAATAIELNKLLEAHGAFDGDARFLVVGLVRNDGDQPLASVRVQAVHDEPDLAIVLGEGVTDVDGSYTIRYSPLPHGQTVRLRVRVIGPNGRILHESAIVSPPQPMEQVNVRVPSGQCVVRVTVRDATGKPAQGLRVGVFDRDPVSETLLGTINLGADGQGLCRYNRETSRKAEKGGADLTLRLFRIRDKVQIFEFNAVEESGRSFTTLRLKDSDGTSRTAQVLFDGPEEVSIQVTLTGSGESEFERNLREAEALMGGVAPPDWAPEHIAFMAIETGIPAEQLGLVAEAHRASGGITDRPPPEIFYGLFRQGLPPDYRRVVAVSPSRLKSALEASVRENIINSVLAPEIGRFVDMLDNLGVEEAFLPATDGGKAPLGQILATSRGLTPAQQRKAVRFLAAHGEESDVFERLAQEPGMNAGAAQAVQFTVQASPLVLDDPGVLAAVQSQGWTSVRDLARIKRDDPGAPTDWKRITQGTPVDPEEIAFRVELTMPTAVIAFRLAEDRSPEKADLNRFFAANPTFDLHRDSVDEFLANGAQLGQVADVPSLTVQLKQWSRLARVTPPGHRFEVAQALLARGFDSAVKIAFAGPTEFLSRMTPIIGETAALQVNESARIRSDAATVFGVAVGDYFRDRAFVLPSASPTGEIPDWAKLFGPTGGCACRHCRSVLSPAAYLVDLLQFLRKAPTPAGRTPILDLLIGPGPSRQTGRYSEAAHLKLNCDNANTPLPYIDLVNEVLELQVAPVAPSPPPAGRPFYQTIGSSDEDKARLKAIPANIHPEAYRRLATEDHPWILPFDLVHEETRMFAEMVGLELHEAFILFDHPRDRVARAHLGLSEGAWDRINAPAPDEATLARMWGLPPGTPVNLRSLDQVPEILTRSSLSFDHLQSLIASRFFAHLELDIDRGADPCDITDDRLKQTVALSDDLAELTPELLFQVLDLIHRFVRLQKALGWSIERLSNVLADRGITWSASPGATPFSRSDLRDAASLVTRWKNPPDDISRFIQCRLPHTTRQALERFSGTGPVTIQLQDALVQGLDALVAESPLWDETAFASVRLRPETRELLRARPTGPLMTRLNRFLLEDAYSGELSRSPSALEWLRGFDLVDLSELTRLAARLRIPVEQAAALRDRAGLARVLRRPEQEVACLLELRGDAASPFDERPHHPIKLPELTGFLDDLDTLQACGLDVFEVRYWLKHVDLTPAVYEPTPTALQAAIQSLYDSMRGADPAFPPAGLDLQEDATQFAVVHAVPLFASVLARLTDESPLFEPGHILDSTGLAARLRSGTDEVSRRLAEHIRGVSDAELEPTLLVGLNAEVRGPSIQDAIGVPEASLRAETRALRDRTPAGFDLAWLNRVLLEDAHPELLTRVLSPTERDARINQFRSAAEQRFTRAFGAARLNLETPGIADVSSGILRRDFPAAVHLAYEDLVAAHPGRFDPLQDALQAELNEVLLEGFSADWVPVRGVWEKTIRATLEHLAGVMGTSVEIVERLVLPQRLVGVPAPRRALLENPRPGASGSRAAMESFLAMIRRRDPRPLPDQAGSRLSENAQNLVGTTYLRLSKVARLIQSLQLTAGDLEIVRDHRGTLGLFDFNSIPATFVEETAFGEFLQLARIKFVEKSLPSSDVSLLKLMELSNVASSVEGVGEFLARSTGWNLGPRTGAAPDPAAPTVLENLPRALGLTTLAHFRHPSSFTRLRIGVEWIRRGLLELDSLDAWQAQPAGPAEPTGIAERRRNVLMRSAQARFPRTLDFHTALVKPQNRLRESRRDALVAYLLAHPKMIQNERGEEVPAWDDSNSLYAHLLIDVEISACQMTSRIVQATSAIQLFVQRCLMNLEPLARLGDSHGSDHWRQWEWMKNYRVWEAARKVFLYPENWLEPDLRDDMSPIYIEAENELLQADVTSESVDNVFRHYLAKLADVARLEIVGLCQENSPGIPPDDRIIYVIGRTFSEPHQYYYCSRSAQRVWTVWTKIDLNLEGNCIVPVIHRRRLLLFWWTFKTTTQRRADSRDQTVVNVHVRWSCLRDGKWSGQQGAAQEALRIALQVPQSASARQSESTSDYYFVRSYLDSETLELWLHGEVGSIARFFWDDCVNSLVLDTRNQSVTIWKYPNDLYQYRGQRLVRINDSISATLHTEIGLVLPETVPTATPIAFSEDDPPLIAESNWINMLGTRVGTLARLKTDWAAQTEVAPLLGNIGAVDVVPAHESNYFTADQPFVLTAENRTYLVSPRTHWEFGLARGLSPAGFDGVTTMERPAARPQRRYQFQALYHPMSCAMSERINRFGIDGILNPPPSVPVLHRQRFREGQRYDEHGRILAHHDPQFETLEPTELVWRNANDSHYARPYEQFDFSQEGLYSTYNWEIFLHLPLLVATRLSSQQRFAEAQRWFQFIFDPTDVSVFPTPAKYWRVKPLFELAEQWTHAPESLEALLRRLAAGDDEMVEQVERWREDPFNPHLIARLRPITYMMAVVMKYLDNLIAWADHLFQRDTMESNAEATQLYVLAAEILGRRIPTVEGPAGRAFSYAEVATGSGQASRFDAFSNWEDIENHLPSSLATVATGGGGPPPPSLPLYFCLPGNDKLASYWTIVEDRLFKLRHCMNLAGQVRQLPLFAPPIDPGLLVRARAMGLDLGAVLNGNLDSSMTPYRCLFLLQRAVEFCGEVRSLSAALLAAIEKGDAEDLARVRSQHEIAMLKRITDLKEQQVREAEELLQARREARTLADARLSFYSSREYMSAQETSQIANLTLAHGNESIAQILNFAASIAHAVPDTIAGPCGGVEYGGTYVGHSLRSTAAVFSFVASQHSFAAQMSSIMGGYDRRRDDWNLQADLARREIRQIDQEILAAQIRLEIAVTDRKNHEAQIQQADEIESFLKNKFSNAQLYRWMIGQLSALHYQAYRMAFDLARRAERAAQHELGLDAASFHFIDFGQWDGQRKGLLAGERLLQDVRRMELAYHEKNSREFEITKHVSLSQVHPWALVQLRETGACSVNLHESLFDLDFPGHFLRRIKTVSLSIPCVTGPYTGVPCTLTLTRSSIRHDKSLNSGSPSYARNPSEEDRRFRDFLGPIESIVTSSGQNDSGLFETNLRDERFLPFEGAGAISEWRIELPGDFRPFDYDAISDVILHLRYTAREGGAILKKQAQIELNAALTEPQPDGGDAGFVRIFSLRHEFPSEWHRFLHPSSSEAGIPFNRMPLPLLQDRFPFFLRQREIQIRATDVVAKLVEAPGAADPEGTFRIAFLSPSDSPGTGDVPSIASSSGLRRIRAGSFHAAPAHDPRQPLGLWTLQLWQSAGGDATRLADPSTLKDLLLVIHYSIA